LEKENIQIKLFVGTPCYGGMITSSYFKSCMQLVALCASKQIELQFATIGNESLITRARNTLVQLFMDGDYTHLLFIDADLAFNPESVLRMVDFNKDVVTGVYPRKTIDWTKVKNKVIDDPEISEDELLATSLQYNLNVKDPNKIEMTKGFIEVMDGATGFMLIKKRVFEQMAYYYPDKQFTPDQHINAPHDKEFDYHETSNWNYTFFDTMVEPETKRYLSEDYAFCRLWQNMGGKIYADITSGMTHYGNFAFQGNVGTQFLPQDKK
jgi:hypothetical protein|tara:strand:- start:3906 stop:4706 length:801 start_codon:yes stop_codon:yes gene_type:complete